MACRAALVAMAALAVAVVAARGPAAAAQTGAPAPGPGGGDHWLYIGTYAGDIQMIDETTGQPAGRIALETGIPRSLVLSFDRKTFYVLDSTLERIEIVDIAAQKTRSSFTLSSGATRTRIRGMQVDPLDRFMILLTRSATKQADRWEIGEIALQLYDLRERRVTRDIPWPDGESRENVNIRFSPDGQLLYFFGEDVLILETANFTEVDTWALSRPIEPGLGRVSFGAIDDFNDDPGFFTGLFTVEDPVQNRRIMGIGRVDLAARRVDFSPIGPAEGVSFSMSPDRRRGYGLLQQIGRYEFWIFDLERRTLVSRTPFAGRPRMALRVSSNGRLLYIYQAGETIDVYEAATFTHLRTLAVTGDQTTGMFVLPRPAGSAAAR